MNAIERRQFLRSASATGLLLAASGALGAIPAALAQGKVKIDAKSVLIVVDVQNCFLPGGSLAVGKGEEVIPIINKLGQMFTNVVMTQDWHTPGHV